MANIKKLLLPCYKPVQHVTVLNTVGKRNTMVRIIILYNMVILWDHRRMYIRSVVDRNVDRRRMTVLGQTPVPRPSTAVPKSSTTCTDYWQSREQSVEF